MFKTPSVAMRVVAVAVPMLLAGPAATQQMYPSKAIRLIVPYAPGSALDVLARLSAQKLTDSLGQPVIVDNRPGGNTVIGSEALVKSPPDGHTIILVVNTHSIIPNLLPNLPYDPVTDFAPLATVTSSELVLITHPSVAANNLREFIALAKARPGQLNYASGGSGTITHLALELFNSMTGVRMNHIPYKGAGPALTDLVGGQVQLFMTVPLVTIPLINSGKLKGIAVTGQSRLTAVPQMPTFSEAGLPGFDVRVWFGYLAPAGTPKAIVDRLSAEFAKLMAQPAFREDLAKQGMDPFVSSPDQFAALIKADLDKYARIIRAANIKLEN